MKKKNFLKRAAMTMLSVFLLLTMLSVTVIPFESMALSNASMSFAKKSTKYVETQPGSHIVKAKGTKNLYYRKNNGKIRTKKGFVQDLGNTYYVQKGGKIARKKTIRVNGYYFNALSNGVIAKGIYTWKGNLSLSTDIGVWCYSEGVYSVGGNSYYVDKKGVLQVNKTVTYKNQPYHANEVGILTRLMTSSEVGNAVINIARQEVGTATGWKYWIWYFKTEFKDTDKTPWCGAFVGWCYYAAGQLDKVSGVKNLGYVPSYASYADTYGKWIARQDAQPGDIIIFGKNKHVGLVEGISHDASGDYIVTIEGNAGITAIVGCGGNGAVVRNVYPINSNKIKGIIRPY